MTYRHPISHLAITLLALTLSSSALATTGGASVDDATKPQLKVATMAYERGVELMEAEKFEQALDAFRQSYSTVASPNSQLMIGRALIKIGRLMEAYSELRHALAQATDLSATQKKYQKTVVSAQKEIDDIKEKLAYVMMRQGASAKIEGKQYGPMKEDEPVPVMPGKVAIEVTYADGATQLARVSLNPGETTELPKQTKEPVTAAPSKSVDEKPVASTESNAASDLGMSRKTLGYIVGGVGVAGVATFIGVGILAASVYGDPSSNCTASRCPQSELDNQASKSTCQGIGYAGLGMGVIGLGLGAWLILGASEPKASSTTALQLGPGAFKLEHRF